MTKRKRPEDKLKVGAPSKLTPQMQIDIIHDLKKGLYVESICPAYGIDVTTFYRWLRTRPEFRQAIKMAEAELQGACLGTIASGTEGWQGSAWIMERRFPRLWSMRVKAAILDHEDELHRRLRNGLSEAAYIEVMRVLSGDGETGAGTTDAEVVVAKLPAA